MQAGVLHTSRLGEKAERGAGGDRVMYTRAEIPGGTAKAERAGKGGLRPTARQLAWLRRGLAQPGGKLPLFDGNGQRINDRTIRTCIEQGWAEPWFDNPIKPDWLVRKDRKSTRLNSSH